MTRTTLLLTTALVLVAGAASAVPAVHNGGVANPNPKGVAVLRVGRLKLLIGGTGSRNGSAVGNLGRDKKALYLPWAGWNVGNIFWAYSSSSCFHSICSGFSRTSLAVAIIGDGKKHTEIFVPLNRGNGTADNVSLNTDVGGLPGPVIAGGSVMPTTSVDCCAMETVEIPATTLTNGVQYWVVVSGGLAAWDLEDSDLVVADDVNKMASSYSFSSCNASRCTNSSSGGWSLFTQAGDHLPAAGLK